MTGTRIIGIVLAGGEASRFGSDKLAATVRGRPLLHRSVDAIAVVATHVIVVIGPAGETPSLPSSVRGRLSLARDVADRGGPLAGLSAGLRAAAALGNDDAGDIALVVGGDMPSLVPAVLERLAGALDADTALLAMTLQAVDPNPLPMAIRVSAGVRVDAVLDSPGRRSLRALLEAIPSGRLPAAAWRPLDPRGATLRDVDTPADIEEA